MPQDRLFDIWFALRVGIASREFSAVLDSYESTYQLFNADAAELEQLPCGLRWATRAWTRHTASKATAKRQASASCFGGTPSTLPACGHCLIHPSCSTASADCRIFPGACASASLGRAP